MSWRIVPIEPTDAMIRAAKAAPYGKPWTAGIAAAPKASEDEALVRLLANRMDVTFGNRGTYEEAARAVLKMLEG